MNPGPLTGRPGYSVPSIEPCSANTARLRAPRRSRECDLPPAAAVQVHATEAVDGDRPERCSTALRAADFAEFAIQMLWAR
jgi:hypothetical protein